MEQDIKEKADKEYIKISKEDFEKIYKAVDLTKEDLLRKSNELLEAYDALVKLTGILERVLRDSLQAKFNETKYNIDHARFTLIEIYSYLNKLIEEILDKIKREQIDKNQPNSEDIKDED